MSEISRTMDHGLAVLECIAEHGPMTTAALTRALGMHRTVVHRAVETLRRRGYVRRITAGYVAGATVLRLADRVEPALLSTARRVLTHLAEVQRETFILTLADDDEAVQCEQAVGSELVRVELVRGFRHDLAAGASGRALLAFMDEATIARAESRVADAAALRLALAEVRANGYSVSFGELSSDVCGLSVPVHHRGAVTASLGVVVPAVRRKRLEELLVPMQEAARTIEQGLEAC